jgi:hypothetical protein
MKPKANIPRTPPIVVATTDSQKFMRRPSAKNGENRNFTLANRATRTYFPIPAAGYTFIKVKV